MRALAITLVAAFLAAPPALAQTQLLTPVTEFAYLGDEPNVNAPGDYPYPGHNTGPQYRADDNGIADALAGISSKVLDADITIACYVDPVHDCTINPLIEPFTGRKYVYHWSQVRVLYGTWNDANGDAYVQNAQWESADPAMGALAGRATTRDTADEWTGVTQAGFPSGTALVTYITGWAAKDTSPTCAVSRESPGAVRRTIGNSATCAGYTTARGSAPSIEYRTDTGRDGYYASLIYVNGIFPPATNDLLVTQIMETFHGVISPESGQRQYSPVAGTPYDTDRFISLDPTIEALFAANLQGAVAIGTSVNNTINSANATYVAPLRATLKTNGVDWDAGPEGFAGPAVARVLPTNVEHNDGLGSNPWDYTQFWHPWVDARPNAGVAVPTPQLVGSVSAWPISHKADGKPHVAPGMIFYPRIMNGLWYDKNGDGFIRNGVADEPAPGCADVSNCGFAWDPNEFAKDHHEFKGLCDPDGIDVFITPMNTGQVWGRTGVYVYGDDDADGKDDNEVDDTIARGAAALVTSGTIRMWSSCNASNSPFQYFSSIRVFFPEGNPDYAIEMRTEEKCTDMNIVGVPANECTFDVDIIEPWL